MSLPSGAIWKCRSGFGVCFKQTTMFRGTARGRRRGRYIIVSCDSTRRMVDTPWRSLLPSDRGREYLALLSYLPLKGFRKMLMLQRQTGKVRAQLASTPGLVGYSFRAKLMGHRFWTLSIWEDERALTAFGGRESAPRHDGHPRAVHGRDRVHAMGDPRFRSPALVGRGDASSR